MDLKEISKEHKAIIDSYRAEISSNKSKANEILTEVYRYVKSISDIYYCKNHRMSKIYEDVLAHVHYCQDKFIFDKKIIKVDTPIDLSQKVNVIDDVIRYITLSTIKELFEQHIFIQDYESIPFDQFNFTNFCTTAANITKKHCDKNKIESHIITVQPGYSASLQLFNGHGFHSFCIVMHEGKSYLIDVTYSQFFYHNNNNLERLGIVNFLPGNVGNFMLMSDEGKEIATKLLTNGYIELTEERLKTYLDAFTMSFRNGLYYENTNDFSYTTSYSFDDYMKFLRKEDNQVKHEGKENLGYQKKPLKNPKLLFDQRKKEKQS